MKKTIFMAIAFVAITSVTNQLFAQDAASKTSGYDQKKAVRCRVITTDEGCSIAFEYDVKSPRDAASGMASGKRGYDYYQAKSDFSVSASDNSVTEVKSPRDAASGLATGKRMHKPMTVSKEYDKSSPKLMEAVVKGKSSSDSPQSEIAIDEPGVQKVSNSGQGAGKVNVQDLSMTKVNVQDISFTKRCGGKSTKISCDGGDCEIPIGDCPNGTCSLTADWSWGLSQSGGTKRCSIDFLLEIEDGVCHAINTKGTGATREGK